MSSKPTVHIPPQGRTIAIVGDVYRFLATGEDTNGKYALFEALVGPGGGLPPHDHSREEEGFYILEGEITFTINGERVVATAGTFANMPVGTPHSFKNESSRPARMLITVAPADLERMFFEVGVSLAEGATTALPPTKEEIEKLLAVAPSYGIEIKLPQSRVSTPSVKKGVTDGLQRSPGREYPATVGSTQQRRRKEDVRWRRLPAQRKSARRCEKGLAACPTWPG